MKKTFKSLMIVTITLSLCLNALFVSVDAEDISAEKISSQLIKMMSEMGETETIDTYIWFEDINHTTIAEKVNNTLGYSLSDVELEEAKIKPIETTSLYAANSKTLVNAYMNETKTEREIISQKIDKYISNKRTETKLAYKNNNTSQRNKINLDDNEIIYQSNYSPVIIAKLTKERIQKISLYDTVTYLGYRESSIPQPCLAYASSAVEATYTRDTLGFDGYGVKVGVYDSGRVGTNGQLDSSKVTRLDTSMPISTHSTSVATIVNYFAPNASIYSNSSNISAEQGLEALIDQNVSVINISLAFGRADGDYYNDFEKWIDHISYQHNVTLVIAAGNNGTTSVVTCPGLAYNAITVGAMDPNGTISKNDDFNCSYSSANNGGTSGCNKPDVIAPGEYELYGGGTSFAAPAITGVIAQMIEYKPTLATNPVLIKAVLQACADRKLTGENLNRLTSIEGAGVINARRAMAILAGGKYWTGTTSSGSITKTFPVTTSDSLMSISLTWSKNNTVSGNHTQWNTTNGPVVNLRLRIYNPSNVLTETANASNSSAELIRFNVNTYGTHTLKVDRRDSNTNTFKYAIAWY